MGKPAAYYTELFARLGGLLEGFGTVPETRAVAEAAVAAGYTDIYKRSLVAITEMERIMGKQDFNRILGHLVYKPQGKITLVPDSDKREAINKTTAAAEFQEVLS